MKHVGWIAGLALSAAVAALLAIARSRDAAAQADGAGAVADDASARRKVMTPDWSFRFLIQQLHSRHVGQAGVENADFEERILAELRARIAEEPERAARADVAAAARERGSAASFEPFVDSWLKVDGLPEAVVRERLELLVDAAVDALDDPFTQAIHPHEIWRQAFSELLGFSSTVGLLAGVDDRGAFVDLVLRGSDPARKGVLRDDRIVAIDGAPTAGKSRRQLQALLDRPCRLSLARGGSGQLFEVELAAFNPGAIATVAALVEPSIGYLSFPLFRVGAFLELRESLKTLIAAGAKAVVLDLRGNPGGLIVEAGAIGGLFIGDGRKVVDTESRDGAVNLDMTAGRAVFPDLPLAVLVDGSSASASEILAAAFQDHHRALLVGERTYGKGIGQAQIAVPCFLSDGGYVPSLELLMVSVISLRSPNGRDWHRRGLEADLKAWPDDDPIARRRARARLLDSPPLHEALGALDLAADEIAALRTAGPAPARLVAAALAAGVALEGAADHDALKDVARLSQESLHPELAACPDLDPPLAKALRALKLALKQQGG